jgi:hypothetical protein
MSYEQAVRFAENRERNRHVLDALRRENVATESSAPLFHRLKVKVNLASALLDSANAANSPAEYTKLYDESEAVLLTALKLHPFNAAAEKNLAGVLQNRKKRPGIAAQDSPANHEGSGVQGTTGGEKGGKVRVDSDKCAGSVLPKSGAYRDRLGPQDVLENAGRGRQFESEDCSRLPYTQSHSHTEHPAPDHRGQRLSREPADSSVTPRQNAPSANALGSTQARADVKASLGTELLSMAEDEEDPAEQSVMLEESEALLRTALDLDPTNLVAVGSLAVLRWKRARSSSAAKVQKKKGSSRS